VGRRAVPHAGIEVAARATIATLLERGPPSLDQVAAAEGLSVRTLQRRLAEHGTSFSALLQDVRMAEALRRLGSDEQPLSELARNLGYRRPSTLTRAVRRWTGSPPSRLRAEGTGAGARRRPTPADEPRDQ
jgi:AraC-like DNA-binding protein